MSKAFQLFRSTEARAVNIYMTALHWHLGVDRPKEVVDTSNKLIYEDMGRAGIVLTVAAMDDYFTRRFSELVVPYIKKKGASEGLVNLLRETGFGVKEALDLALTDRPLRRVRALIDSRLGRYTAQRFELVDELFSCVGLRTLSLDAEKLSGRKTLRRSVEILVERRHRIVHDGDYNRHGKVVPLDFGEFAN